MVVACPAGACACAGVAACPDETLISTVSMAGGSVILGAIGSFVCPSLPGEGSGDGAGEPGLLGSIGTLGAPGEGAMGFDFLVGSF